ncbi:hypothetical protein L211DRAFT_834102 [Terfezia boudieri ATCC MYA-4762]|uniref:HIT-type domain-containing protein n=1 Tax=Terfezia boudieri ATCC MYA-4762 TaxID=1051890 RepID=A0A3N4LZ01_9PEZI|nr:hypothetical protein L211DRAFT_834102 [Terfezia boudieri ATCC MYA-4762]
MPLCQLCNVAESRYKCPTCLMPYCSLACYKPHKTEHEANPAPAPIEAPATSTAVEPSSTAPSPPGSSIPPPSAATAPTITPSTSTYTSLLLTHPTLLAHLRSTPSLHSLLYQIYLATLEPPPSPQKPTNTPSNSYKISKHQKKTPIWTPPAGIAKGVKRLNKIREKGLAGGGDGGALEEFVGMVVGCIGEGGTGVHEV